MLDKILRGEGCGNGKYSYLPRFGCFLKHRVSSNKTPRFLTSDDKVMLVFPRVSVGVSAFILLNKAGIPIIITSVLLWFSFRKFWESQVEIML